MLNNEALCCDVTHVKRADLNDSSNEEVRTYFFAVNCSVMYGREREAREGRRRSIEDPGKSENVQRYFERG